MDWPPRCSTWTCSRYTNHVFRHLYSKAYIDLVNKAPEVLGWIYDHLDVPGRNEKLRLALDRLNTVPFISFLNKYQPDVAICTHFLPSEIISWLKSEGKVRVLNAVVVTDLDVHAMWLCGQAEQYFVALEETKFHLVALGVPETRVTISGIPVDPVFAEAKDPQTMSASTGSTKTSSLSWSLRGGSGLVRSSISSRHSRACLGPRRWLSSAAVTSNCAPAWCKVVPRFTKTSSIQFHLLGFTTEMDELMAASDLFVGKPGGLTTSEALAKGLPMVVINPIPGQEERNSDHLLEEGIAIRCNNLPALAYKIDRLIDEPGKLHLMRGNAWLWLDPTRHSPSWSGLMLSATSRCPSLSPLPAPGDAGAGSEHSLSELLEGWLPRLDVR